MEDLTKPEVCWFDDRAAELIISWGQKAIEYEIATELVTNLMIETFSTRRMMELAGNEIRFYLRRSLSTDDQEVLNLSEEFIGTRNQSPEQKGIVKKRTAIINRIRRLFKRLLDECFPSAIPMMAVEYKESPAKSDSSPTKSEHSVGADLSEKIGEICDGIGEVQKKLQKPVEQATVELSAGEKHLLNHQQATRAFFLKKKEEKSKEQATRSRWNKSSFEKATEQDLFETPLEMTNLLSDILPTLVGKKVLEPCHGNGAITDYLRSSGMDVMARDKYTMVESHDFLTEPIPDEIDVVITNPPFNQKYEFLTKLSAWGKMFILLLPVESLFTKKGFPVFQSFPFGMIIFNGKSSFLHAGKQRQVSGCAWFLCRMPDAERKFIIKELGNAGDEELGSEDTEGDDEDDEDEDDEDEEYVAWKNTKI